VRLALFVGGGVTISALMEALHAARRRAEAAARQAQAHQEALRRGEERFRLLVENARDYAIFMLDPEGRITSWDVGAERVLGYRAEEIVGQPVARLFTPEDVRRGEHEREIAQAAAEGRADDKRWHVRADGTRFWVDGVLASVRDEGGSLRGFVKVMRDFTARKRAEEGLARHARQQATVALLGQRALAGVERDALMEEAVALLAGNLEAEFAQVLELRPDRAFLLKAGLGWRDGLVGRAAVEADAGSLAGYTLLSRAPVLSEDLDAETRFRAPALLREHGVTGTATVLIHGRERPFGVLGVGTRGRRTFTDNDIHFLQAVANLIASAVERDRAAGHLKEAKEAAEAASRAKDDFLAVLSHELRTPLTPVLAIVTALQGRHEVPEELRPTMELIRRSVELEARLIDDLLDVTRIARGKMPLSREVVDAHALDPRSDRDLPQRDLRQQLRLGLRLEAPRSHVHADPARLQQVLWNLIKNAVKFTPAGGAVTISTRNEGEPGRLVIEVNDTGIGIEPEAQPKIFNAFEQGDQGTTRQFGGLGLGLAISRALVRAHDGSLTVRSPGRGQGATFRVELATVPAPIPRAGIAPPSEPPAPQRLALKILLVEDDSATRGVMTRILRQQGYQVTAAATLREALEAGLGEEFDLLISDIGLPDGTGLDLMRELRAKRPVRGIALTGYGMDEDIRKSRAVGFAAHLTKPLDFRKLEATIQNVTSRPDHGPSAP
jgi:PAS domain S-box-containing protein